eukprot:scaffold2277_cov128-Skeletonema_marinoi.AAC.13
MCVVVVFKALLKRQSPVVRLSPSGSALAYLITPHMLGSPGLYACGYDNVNSETYSVLSFLCETLSRPIPIPLEGKIVSGSPFGYMNYILDDVIW